METIHNHEKDRSLTLPIAIHRIMRCSPTEGAEEEVHWERAFVQGLVTRKFQVYGYNGQQLLGSKKIRYLHETVFHPEK